MRKLLQVVLFLALSCLIFNAQAQEKVITGTITAKGDNEALPGVSVLVKGTSTGSITDIDGKYRISVPESAQILVFSYVGFRTAEAEIGSQSIIDFSLESDDKILSEVVVTAIGLEREKAALGYSVQQVGGDELTQSGETNLIDAMNSKVAGVQITSAGGAPGSGSYITVRGATSLRSSGQNQPLFVIDGIPIDNSIDFTADPSQNSSGNRFYAATASNRAMDINPNDIENISVLKGAAATTLYGIRAANGAVIITTKSGGRNSGKRLNVTYDGSFSIDEVNKYPKFQKNYARGRNGVYSNVTHWSWGPDYRDNPVFPDGTSIWVDNQGNTDVSGQPIPYFDDNYKNFWTTGNSQNHSVSVSGGGENGNFYLSVGRLNQTGIVPNSEYGRTNVSLRIDQNITDKFKVGGYAGYTNSGGLRINQSYAGPMYAMGYFHHMWDVNGQYEDENGDPTWFSGAMPHPQWAVNKTGLNDNVNRLIGNINFSYDILDWLTLSYKLGIDTYGDSRKQVFPIGTWGFRVGRGAGQIREDRISNTDLNSDLLLTGNKDLGEHFSLNFVIGNNIYQSNYDRIYIQGDGLNLKGFDDISNASERLVRNITNGKRLIGVFGDVTVGYRDMLFLGVAARNDWSSTLPSNNNSFLYPSVNLGFVFTELMKNNVLSFGKLRASWAQVGKDAPVQSLLNTYESSSPRDITTFNGNVAFTVGDVQKNPTLKPETTTSMEFGADLKFFQNKLGIDVTYYDVSSKDQIISIPLASTTGFGAFVANSGEITNKGWEVMATINNPITVPGLDWNLGVNFTRNRSEVVSIIDGLDQILLGGYSDISVVAQAGQPFGTLWGTKYARTESGELLIGDDGYPVLDSEQGVVGNTQPDWIMGINGGLSFKGLSFNFVFDIKQGGDIVNYSDSQWIYAGLSHVTDNRNTMKVFEGVLADGSQNTQEVILDNNFYHQNYVAAYDNLVEDASWLRLRSVGLNYSLPSKWFANGPIGSISVSAKGRNLWLKTDYTGIDPETSSLGPTNAQGFDNLSFPNTKSYIFGVRASF